MKMHKFIVADTSGFISLLSKDDKNHTSALHVASVIHKDGKTIILPGEIITEFINVLGKKANHRVAIQRGDLLLHSPEYKIVDTNEHIRSQAFALFKKQPESVSFTDCIVMAFADEYETKEIFGFDEAFAKNGYIRFGIDTK